MSEQPVSSRRASFADTVEKRVRIRDAALDLYAALKAIMDNEQIDGIGGGRITLTFDYRSPLAMQARAALKKAENL